MFFPTLTPLHFVLIFSLRTLVQSTTPQANTPVTFKSKTGNIQRAQVLDGGKGSGETPGEQVY